MTDKTDKEPHNESTSKSPKEIEEMIKGILWLIFLGYWIWVFFISHSSSTSEISTPKISAEATNICQKLVDATNEAFTSNKLFRKDATVLKLKAVKASVKYDWDDYVSCELYIKNDGNLIIQIIKGNLYYFDNEGVSDKKWFYIDTVIRPQETIKEEISHLPKNITKMEIRDDDGNKSFDCKYAVEYNGVAYP